MRNPEDTKFVWDEKNFNTVKEALCSKSYTEEVLKLLVDACIEYEIIDVKATEGSDIKTINEYEIFYWRRSFCFNCVILSQRKNNLQTNRNFLLV